MRSSLNHCIKSHFFLQKNDLANPLKKYKPFSASNYKPTRFQGTTYLRVMKFSKRFFFTIVPSSKLHSPIHYWNKRRSLISWMRNNSANNLFIAANKETDDGCTTTTTTSKLGTKTILHLRVRSVTLADNTNTFHPPIFLTNLNFKYI